MSDHTNNITNLARIKGPDKVRSFFKSSVDYIERGLSRLIKKEISSVNQDIDQYNVLIIGETQSGKSTLTQCMKKYADQDYKIELEAIGTGYLSHTTDVNNEDVTTNLPEYYVSQEGAVKDVSIDYENFKETPDKFDYEDLINLRRGLKMKPGKPLLDKKVRFKLIDTPGLNATAGDDEEHIQKIFKALIETKTIHLVIFNISSGPFTQGLQDAIKAYVDMFPGFNGIIAFVHTHFDYKNFHPACHQVSGAIDRKTQALHKIMGRTTFPHFKIDCNINNKKPIRECITQNTIQKILALAIFNHPVDMLHTVINKTRKMRDIDSILQDKFESTSCTIEKTLRFSDENEGQLVADIYHNETKVYQLEAKIKVLEEYFDRHDVSLLEILHEERLDKNYEIDGQEESFSIRYPETEELDFAIKKRDLLLHSVNLIEETPTDDMQQLWADNNESPWRAWEGKFERTSQHSVLHVKIYAIKSSIHQEDIDRKRAEYNQHKLDLVKAKATRDSHAYENESKMNNIKAIIDSQSEGIQILRFVANGVLTPDIFNALIAVKAYMGDAAECAMKVQSVYMALAKVDAGQKIVS